MISVNRSDDRPRLVAGWDPYEVWYARVRSVRPQPSQLEGVRAQLDPVEREVGLVSHGSWARSTKILVRLLQTTSFLSV